MDLIYIGDHFYRESKTMISSIYTPGGQRSDWGFVQIALRNGENVNIRQATPEEIEPYQRKLDAMKADDA